jgi:glycosyltransferase EpsF
MSSRVLHVVENLDRGSVETWLLQMLGHAGKRGLALDWTFYCALDRPGSKDDQAKALGAKIIYSPVPIGRKLAFVRALRAELKRGGYDVLHAQHDLVSAVYLAAAIGVPLRRRVVHVHNADEQVLTDNPVKVALLRPLLRRGVLALADRIAANSNHSLDTFLAGRRRRPGRDVVHYLGVDPTRFEAAKADRAAFRRELGLAPEALVLLFAGRMTPEKNPVFVVDVLVELRRLVPAAVGVFVGSGSLEPAVRQRVAALGLEDAVRCLGWRGDVPEIMNASDLFILPHPEKPVEAFGIAVVEAQLAGLPMLLSLGILDDPLLPTASFCRLSLSEPPSVWARAGAELLAGPKPSRAAALTAHRESPMDMDRALTDLLGLYA